MLVQRVLTPDSSLDSWTVLGDGGPVEPIERYLAYLTDIEQSPNTIKAYAHDLKDWFVFLAARGLEWREGVASAAERNRSLTERGSRATSGARHLDDQVDQALCLTLVTNAAVLWTAT
jgi:site-specific recombinase XerC